MGVLVIAVVGALLLVVSSGTSAAPGGSASTSADAKRIDADAAARARRRRTVSARDNFFRSKTVTIRRRGRVTWKWRGSNPHNVTFTKVPRRGSKRGSRTQTRGSFRRTFKRRGTYSYVCTIHAGMVGKVVTK